LVSTVTCELIGCVIYYDDRKGCRKTDFKIGDVDAAVADRIPTEA